MMIFLAFLALACLWKIDIRRDGDCEDYLSINQTTAIRGALACVIFLSHLRDYINLSSSMGNVYEKVFLAIGQCMVAPFFFYSGYGILQSYLSKKDYRSGFLRKRLVVTWVHFATAVLIFYIVDGVLEIHYPTSTVLLAFTGWTDIGNSNWFMFVTFALYIIAWISMSIVDRVMEHSCSKERSRVICVLILLLSGVLMAALAACRNSWWYDTLLCFSFGGFYGIFKEKIDDFCSKNLNYWVLLLTVIIFLLIFYYADGGVTYNIFACLFTMLIGMTAMKVRVQNPALLWLGRHSFYIYIYMRIPMMVLKHFGVFSGNNYLFTIFTFLITCISAWIMNCVHKNTDRFII